MWWEEVHKCACVEEETTPDSEGMYVALLGSLPTPEIVLAADRILNSLIWLAIVTQKDFHFKSSELELRCNS